MSELGQGLLGNPRLVLLGEVDQLLSGSRIVRMLANGHVAVNAVVLVEELPPTLSVLGCFFFGRGSRSRTSGIGSVSLSYLFCTKCQQVERLLEPSVLMIMQRHGL